MVNKMLRENDDIIMKMSKESLKAGPGPGLIPLETRIPISLKNVAGVRTSEGDLFLKPGGRPTVIEVTAPEKLADMAWRLRLTGEIDLERRLQNEGDVILLYHLIEDSLDRTHAHHQTYCLALHSRGEAYPQRAYTRGVCT